MRAGCLTHVAEKRHVRDNSFQPWIECGDGERDPAALAGSGNRDPLVVDIGASHQVIDVANHIRVRRLIIRALRTVETPGEFVGCVNLPKLGRRTLRARINLEDREASLAFIEHDALLGAAVARNRDDCRQPAGRFATADG